MVRVLCGFLVVAMTGPLYVFADVLDRPFFGGALGRAAYSVPNEFVRHVEWPNELRFTFPPGFTAEAVAKKGVLGLRAYGRHVRNGAEVATAVAVVAARDLVKTVAMPYRYLYAESRSNVAAVEARQKENPLNPVITYIELSPPKTPPRCSRAAGFARYAWCLLETSKAE